MIVFNRSEGIDWDPRAGERDLRRLLDEPRRGRVPIILVDGEPAGYAVITYGYDLEYGGDEAFLTEFHLEQNVRGRGVGRCALETLLDDLRRNHYGALHLQVRPENIAAQRLYQACGFENTTRMFFTRRLSDP
jgi:ribosomal protein S18 acetylase RimI-like enzyme